jgi:two-component system, NarL family, invasion response regulator UvrY
MISVLIADDHAIVRRGLRQLLEGMGGVKVVGEVGTGVEVPDAVDTLRPEVLVLDVSMPDTNFLELLALLHDRAPRLRTLILSVHAEAVYARRAIQAGAAGYITKDRADAELVEALRLIARGRRYVSPQLAQELADDLATGRGPTPEQTLTNREHEVMLFLAAGHTVTDIAALLTLSVKTVSTHRTRIMRKMQLSSNAELARYALSHGLLS